jgi:mono/diheme cytochrome c family protein
MLVWMTIIGPVRKSSILCSRARGRASTAALLATTLACGDDAATSGSEGPPVHYARDVAPIIERHCVSCHGSSAFAPFPLLSYEDVFEHAQDAVDAIASHKMPLCAQQDESCGPSADELETLVRWLAQGRPR